ncbi:MAG: NAD-dependent epimerase/dehydratase family protein [Pseudomonadota bacterium]
MTDRKVLIVGASGLVGTAAAQAFIHAGWSVLTTSRRRPDLLRGDFEHQPLDLRDAEACAAFANEHIDISHVVYTAVYEMPGLIAGWSDPEQIEINDQMLQNLLAPLTAQAKLEHVTLLQGTKAYGAAVAPMRIPARESQPRVEHPNFYWRQEDYLRAQAEREGYTFTILRPQLIVGPNHGVVMNLPPIIGVYASLCKHLDQPCGFPGGADWVWEAVDVRLVGEACVWAAITSAAAGETYNLTNGEVFCWRDMWPAMAASLEVDIGPDKPLSVAEFMLAHGDTWRTIADTHDLVEPELTNILGESHFYADLCFAYGADTAPKPALVSTVKIKQAGFTATYNTEESFCFWLHDLRYRRVIP